MKRAVVIAVLVAVCASVVVLSQAGRAGGGYKARFYSGIVTVEQAGRAIVEIFNGTGSQQQVKIIFRNPYTGQNLRSFKKAVGPHQFNFVSRRCPFGGEDCGWAVEILSSDMRIAPTLTYDKPSSGSATHLPGDFARVP